MNVNPRLTIGQTIGMAAAILVLLCFLFPWIELNFFLVSANLSGLQLATGNGPAGANFPGVPSLLLVPLSMLVVLAIGLACLLSSTPQVRSMTPALLLAAGGLSALIILYQYLNLNQELNKDVMGMITQKVFTYAFGAHASLAGSLVVAGAGLLDLATRKPRSQEDGKL